MPKKRKPSYLCHKPTGQARVRIDGKDHYRNIACAAMERLRGRVQLVVRVPMDCWQQWIRHRTASAAASEMNAAGSWLRSGSWAQTSQPGNPLIGNGLCVLASRNLEFGRT